MNVPMVLVDNKKGILARLVNGRATDVIRFPKDTVFEEDEIEMFRAAPVDFKEEFAL
jgi:hypothetical protein